MSVTYPVEISDNKSIPLPEEVCRRYHFMPRGKVLIRAEEDHLVIEKASHEDVYEEVRALAEACFSDVAWEEIEQGRTDRCV